MSEILRYMAIVWYRLFEFCSVQNCGRDNMVGCAAGKEEDGRLARQAAIYPYPKPLS